MSFISFLLNARKAFYSKKKFRNLNTFEYKQNKFMYSYLCKGYNPFSGIEIVYYDSIPIWTMHYYGKAIYDEAFIILREALKPSKKNILRGPSKLKINKFTYINKSVGNIRLFSGDEIIYKGKDKIYELKYFGGITLPKLLDLKKLRSKLKKPLGKLTSITDLINKYKHKKIIAVGDEVTYLLVSNGVKPFVAVYDFKTMRKSISEEKKKVLLSTCSPSFFINNEPGTINTSMFYLAKKLVKEGGYVKVDGEEDLLTLTFIPYINDHVLVYGQPNKCVVVNKKETLKFIFKIIPLFP